MSPELRDALAGTAAELGAAVKANEPARVQAMTIAELAGSFGPTAYLLRTTAARLAGDALTVTQVYELDARGRPGSAPAEADFACPLSGTTSETDFDIPALPPGLYGFAMVEARGAQPWLLSFLLRQDAGVWKLAGFTPSARMAAGHDGLWYWRAARDDAKAKHLWRAWLLYGEADALLRPANFVTSTNLDKLRSEQRAAMPPELADGLGPQTPLVLKGAGEAEFRYTAIRAEGSEDGSRLNLMLHYTADATTTDVAAEPAQNVAAAKVLLDAHKDLRQGFDGVWVFAEAAGREPFATELKMTEIP